MRDQQIAEVKLVLASGTRKRFDLHFRGHGISDGGAGRELRRGRGRRSFEGSKSSSAQGLGF